MKEALTLIKHTAKEWQQDRVPMLAASLSYYTVFSIAPLLIIIIAVLGFALGEQAVQGNVIRQIRDLLGMDAALFVQSLIENQRQTGGGLWATVFGIGMLLIGASGVFIQLQNALNAIWGVEPGDQKGGVAALVMRRLVAFSMILVIGALLLVALLVPTVISLLEQVLPAGLPGSSLLWRGLTFVVSVGVLTLVFGFIFRYLPDVEIRWQDVWVGAAVTALLFTVGNTLLSLYLSRGATASAYGAAGSLVLILLWVFYSAQIVLTGAEFAQVYARRHGHGITTPGERKAGAGSKKPEARS